MEDPPFLRLRHKNVSCLCQSPLLVPGRPWTPCSTWRWKGPWGCRPWRPRCLGCFRLREEGRLKGRASYCLTPGPTPRLPQLIYCNVSWDPYLQGAGEGICASRKVRAARYWWMPSHPGCPVGCMVGHLCKPHESKHLIKITPLCELTAWSVLGTQVVSSEGRTSTAKCHTTSLCYASSSKGGYLSHYFLRECSFQNNPLKPWMVNGFGVEKELTKRYFWKEILSSYSKVPLIFSLAFNMYWNMWL